MRRSGRTDAADEAVQYAKTELNGLREQNGQLSDEVDELRAELAELRAELAELVRQKVKEQADPDSGVDLGRIP